MFNVQFFCFLAPIVNILPCSAGIGYVSRLGWIGLAVVIGTQEYWKLLHVFSSLQTSMSEMILCIQTLSDQ